MGRKKGESAEALKTLRLSPSSINSYNKCPRRWYYEYIEAKQSDTSIHLQRGSAVHEALEFIFNRRSFPSGEQFRTEMMAGGLRTFETAWKKLVTNVLPDLDEETNEKFYIESKFMIERFVNKFCDNMQSGIQSGAYGSERQAYYFTKPVFREFWLDDQYEVDYKGKAKLDKDGNKIPIPDSLHVGGFIDAVNKSFDGGKVLVDYKTSKKYKNALSEEYTLQLAIYAYLWGKQFGTLPEYVAINYLKYDETFYIQVTPSLIQLAKDKLSSMRCQIVEKGIDKKKYPANFTKLCDWCPFQEECSQLEAELSEEQK